MQKMKKLFVLTLLSLVFFSCKDKTPNNDNLFKFKDYIIQTTSGIVSSRSNIVVKFNKKITKQELNSELTETVLDISPETKGMVVVKDNYSIVFIPETKLNPDTEYTINVHLNNLFEGIPKELKKYQFQFKTITPNFNLDTKNIQSYSKEWQYLEGYLHSADALSLEECQSILTATQEGKDLSIKWQEINSKSYDFIIDSISRKENDSEVQIKWNGKPLDIDNTGKKNITIPGKNNFSIVGVSVIQNPEQYLAINFSDPLKKRQNFNGLVSISGVENIKCTVDGNVLKAYPSSRVVGTHSIEVFSGIKSTDGIRLKKAYKEQVAFAQKKPAIRLLNQGSILPNSSELNFNFEAVNLKSATVRVIKIYEDNVLQFLQNNELNSRDRYGIRQVGRRVAKKKINLLDEGEQNSGEWKAYAVDLSELIHAEPGAIYRVEMSFDMSDSVYNCEESEIKDSSEDDEYEYYDDEYYEEDFDTYTQQSPEDEEEREEMYWDNLLYSYKNYPYNWRQRDNPCHPAYYNQDRIVTQNILASNLGVIAKKGENKKYNFAVTNILNTNPISGAKISLYNFQQQEIATLTTSSEGLAEYKADKNAYFAIVSNGPNKTYIKLDDGNSLSLSKFNVSGKKLKKGLKGYLYGERGVWRPGDTLHLTFVLNDKSNPIPTGHPIKFELRDARGKLVNKQLSQHGEARFHKFIIPTDSDAPTGNWSAKVSVGGAKFTKTLKVATVKPNRLKIKIDFGESDFIKVKEGVNGDLEVKWLHGAPAKDLKAEVQMKLYSSTTSFEQYPNYLFQDPTREFDSEEISIFDSKVNSEGKAHIYKQFPNISSAPGMLKASFYTRAFENGGDFSMDVFSKKVSPYISYVGLQKPESRAYGSYFTDEDTTFDLVTVSDEGNPIKRNGLQLRVYKIDWRWWWSSSYDNLASYVSSEYHEQVYDKTINTDVHGKASFTLNIPENKGGRYLIRIYDPKSGHATGTTTYFYRNWWRSPEGTNGQSANMLLFATDKDNYNVGETAQITFPSGANGRALISIENGSEVVAQHWVKTNKGETKVSIPITADMSPNVFINISLLQPHADTANDLPLRLYGIIPIMVEDPDSRITPVLDLPDVLKPETEYKVNVSEKTGKAMTYTLAVVDEGLLDLTRFKTPNIWDDFNKKQALGVTTWDIFDQVIGAYGGSIDQVFSIGGDEEAAAKKGKKANRFKPVVTYLGPFRLEKGQTSTHRIKMPNYIGSVRVMLVAGDNASNAYGSVDKTVPVRKPLMVLATLPRKLSPGEKLQLPVTVFAMEDKVKEVAVSLKLSKGIQIIGSKTQQLSFAKPDEKMLYFELDVSQAKGINTVEVIAQGNGETSTYKVEIDVVNPNPITSQVNDLELRPNAIQEIDFETFGVTGSNMASIEFSTIPAMDFSKRMQYLIQYPHGCVEQTTSSVFPQLFMPDVFDLTAQRKQEIDQNIKDGIKRLGLFQTNDGGMSYWIGERESNDWGTSYSGHFMIEAEKKGYKLPLTFMTNWLRYQKQQARSWRPTYKRYNTDLAQAYRLYTLALSGHADLASMNRLREFKAISNDAKWRLAAAYALAGHKKAATDIITTANIDFQPHKYDYYSYGDVNRNRAMALETMLLIDDSSYIELAKSIAKKLSSKEWMSTQTTAYSLLSMAKIVEKGGGKNINISYDLHGVTNKINTNKPVAQRGLNSKDGSNSIRITNNENNTVFVRILNSGKLPLGTEIPVQRNLTAQVEYLNTDGTSININRLTQGTDFIAKVSIRNTSRNYVENIALTELFPSGWEILNTSFTDMEGGSNKQADFTDIRDDRVNFYFNLGSHNSKTFTVQLNAAYLGKYYKFGVQAEAMYDDDYMVRSKGNWIEVVK